MISGTESIDDPKPRWISFEGERYSFPWDTCDKEVAAYLESLPQNPTTPNLRSDDKFRSSPVQSDGQSEFSITHKHARVVGEVIGTIFGLTLGSLIGALVVRFATEFVAKFVPPFKMAYKASFVGSVAAYLLGLAFILTMVGVENDINLAGYAMLIAIGFIVYSAVLSFMIKHPESGRIGFGKACLVSLAQTATMAVIIAGTSLIVAVAIGNL